MFNEIETFFSTLLIIKGRNLIEHGKDEVAIQGDYGPLRIAVVPCLDEKLALATKGIFGDN